jgi:hypothetical protein
MRRIRVSARMPGIFVAGLALLILSLACGLIPTPEPTLTPTPTQTPAPTPTQAPTPTNTPTTTPTPTPEPMPVVGDTVTGRYWEVTVEEAETDSEFGDYYFPDDSQFQFVILTIECTNLRPEDIEWTPQTVVLAYIGRGELAGWARTAVMYAPTVGGRVRNLEEEIVLVNWEAGETRTFQIAFGFPRILSEFVLYFPETPGISIDTD